MLRQIQQVKRPQSFAAGLLSLAEAKMKLHARSAAAVKFICFLLHISDAAGGYYQIYDSLLLLLGLI